MIVTQIQNIENEDLIPISEMNRFDLSTMINLLDSVVEDMFDTTIDVTEVKTEINEFDVSYKDYMIITTHCKLYDMKMQKTKNNVYVFSLKILYKNGVTTDFFSVE